MPWIFSAAGLLSPISRLDFGGESKIDFREEENDIGSDLLLAGGAGVMFMLMKAVLESSSSALFCFGEYDIGVFCAVVGLGARGTFSDGTLETGALCNGFVAYG